MRKLVPYALVAQKKGIKVYHLNIGDPDIKTPQPMLNVLKRWSINPIGYDQSQGNPNFINSVYSYYRKLGFTFIKESNIQATSGGSEAISLAMFATCQEGDEIIVFEPFYANYNTYAVVNGVKLVPITTTISNGFHLPDIQVIESKISKKTKAILICNPGNPTGTVYTKDEIEMLVDIARKNKLFLLSDEVYREYTYEGRKQISLLSYMSKIPKLAVLMDSMSKRYSVCGIRVGCLVSLNQKIMSGILCIAQGRLSCGLVDQLVAAKLTDVPDSYLVKVNNEYKKRRDIIYHSLKKIPGVTIPNPEGAFYAVVRLPVNDAEKFSKWLLTDFHDHKETIMLAPAAGFYKTPGLGKKEVRIAYVINQKDLKRSVEILKIALNKYNK